MPAALRLVGSEPGRFVERAQPQPDLRLVAVPPDVSTAAARLRVRSNYVSTTLVGRTTVACRDQAADELIAIAEEALRLFADLRGGALEPLPDVVTEGAA